MPSKRRRPRRSPVFVFTLIALVGLATLFAAPVALWEWHPLVAYALAISVVTFLLYGYDKGAARWQISRVPERTLHLFMFAGGTPGALAGQELFRHKTAKRSFRTRFQILLALQAAAIGAIIWWRWSEGGS